MEDEKEEVLQNNEELMEETIESKTEKREEVTQTIQRTEGGWICPNCEEVVPFFVTKKYSPYARCPSCGYKIFRRELPPEAIKTVSDVIYKSAGNTSLDNIIEMIEESEGKKPEEPRAVKIPEAMPTERRVRVRDAAREREELFERPKHPCEILQEICEEFGLNETFEKWMVRRCERLGGLHPVEFYHFMRTMKSGVKNEQEAAFIAEEYAVALQREQEKAQKQGIAFMVPTPTVATDSSPYVQRLLQISPPYQQTQQAQQYTPSSPPPRPVRQYGPQAQPQYYAYQQPGITARDIVEIMKVTKDMFAPQNNTTQNMQLMAQTIAEAVVKSMTDLLKPILDKLAASNNTTNLQIIKELAETKAQLSYKDALLEIHSKTLEAKDKEIEALKETVNKLIDQIEKDREEMLRLSQKAASVSGDYKTDEARLLAQSLQQLASLGDKVVDALDKRQPIKIIVESLPHLLPKEQKPIPQKFTESETSTNITEILKKEGLVEE